jgi:four helix bundle protein
MKKKTSNVEHRTSNTELKNGEFRVEWRLGDYRINEAPPSAYGKKRVQKFDLEERLLNFAVQIIQITEALPNTRAANHIAGQVLRSGTSPYGNHGEVEAAESLNDFVHKLKVCLKELRETRRWLLLIGQLKTQTIPPGLASCLSEAEELVRIFKASVNTAEKRRGLPSA